MPTSNVTAITLHITESVLHSHIPNNSVYKGDFSITLHIVKYILEIA